MKPKPKPKPKAKARVIYEVRCEFGSDTARFFNDRDEAYSDFCPKCILTEFREVHPRKTRSKR